MSEKKLIAVLGATGAQGGGLVRELLANSADQFAVRALTRHPDSDKAKALAALGAEVMACDVDSAESLNAAFAGAWGAYCVTFFWEHMSVEKEQAQAKMMAEAAKANGVKHVIWSTLEDTRNFVPLDDPRMPTLYGKYKVPHFDGKGEANQFFIDAGVPTTILNTSFYWDNLIAFGMGPKRGDDGKLSFVLPMADKKLAGIAAADIGKCAAGIFRRSAEFIGKTVGIAGDHLTGEQMAAALSKALGEEVVYTYVPPEVYRTFGFPGADDLGNMFQFYRDFEEPFCAARPLDETRKLNPALQSFEAWLAANASRIPLG